MQSLTRMKEMWDVMTSGFRSKSGYLISLCLIFHCKKQRSSFPSTPPLLAVPKASSKLCNNCIINDHMWSLSDVQYTQFHRRLWRKMQLFKTHKNIPVMIAFKAKHHHLGRRWSFQSRSLCLLIKINPKSSHLLSPLTYPLWVREEHLGHSAWNIKTNADSSRLIDA